MKLVIGGATGFVGSELVRQALANPAITSIIALGRRETEAPPEGDSQHKLKSVVVGDFETYSDNVRKELQNADACIWTIAVTPSKLKTVSFEETSKVSRDYAVTALRTLSDLREQTTGPLRFVYISGHFAPRSREEVPKQLVNHDLVEYGLVRGEAESRVLDFAQKSGGAVEACVAKPGLIHGPGRERREIPGLPSLELNDIAAALLHQVVNGFEKDTLSNDDMTRIGQRSQ